MQLVYPELSEHEIVTFAADHVNRPPDPSRIEHAEPAPELLEQTPNLQPTAITGFNRANVVSYAYTWATHGSINRNLIYPNFTDNDCTIS
ncbi:hypothetical protein [Sorangium cellulosum]|uniref:Uncharacterized protein n=1 Tax=Sorangium cellulosum TaxID=56 RepID=A0A150R1B4_SORCE|nr:hypothetical protein [Sorangium cellulosum]KYF74015.1 hypothetical protein BE15_43195 [Sorangium cellulosum]